MSQNSTEPREVVTPGVREDQHGGARSTKTVPQPTVSAQTELFPGEQGDLIARPVPVQTSGRLEFAARCPSCSDWHRHIGLGERRAPCGAVYRLEFKGAA